VKKDVIADVQKLSLVGILATFLAFGSIFDLYITVSGQLEQQQQSVRVLSSSEYRDDAGYYHIIGEVENNSPDAREFVKITASLYESTNKIVETAFTYTDVDVIRSG
jgi:hypothetical protein